MDAEDAGSSLDSGGDAGDGAGVSLGGVFDFEDFADDGFSGDGEEDGSSEFLEFVELAEDGEVVLALFCEVDSGVDDDFLCGESGGVADG